VGNGDDGIGHFDRGFFEPNGEIVTAAELFPLPRTERLEGMDGEDEGKAVVQLREDAAEMGIPGVEVDDVRIDSVRVEIEAALKGTKDGMERFRRGVGRGIDAESGHRRIRAGLELVAETAYLHLAEFRQFAGEVLHVDPRAPVNMGRILVREKKGLHRSGQESGFTGDFKNEEGIAIE
jgi:hypothetical protein